jgi:DNA-binding transcriptional MocR family regulator
VFFWVELPLEIDMLALLSVALEKERVAFIPGHAFTVDASNRMTNCDALNTKEGELMRLCNLAAVQ